MTYINKQKSILHEHSIKKIILRTTLFLLVFVSSGVTLFAQDISDKDKKAVVEKIRELIKQNYLDEKLADGISRFLKQQKYEEKTVAAFRRKLTRDLRKFSKDKHFLVLYSSKNDFSHAITDSNKKKNYGFTKVEILKGNIGYLKIASFEDPKIAGGIAESSLNFLSNADAIVIDLRANNGGRKAMVQLLLSHFFRESSKHLYSIYGRNEEFHGYTEVTISGKRNSEIPLYILINKSSFSASEMFAFILQKQKRATLIGKTTVGGGHTIGNFKIANGFSVNLPVGKVVDAKTKMGWEKVGVKPDVEVVDGKYLERAHMIALENKLSSQPKSSDRFDVKWQLDIHKSNLIPQKPDQSILKSYVGTYGKRIVSFEDGEIYYQGRAGIDKTKLVAIDDLTFRFKEVDFFRIRFVLNKHGKVIGVKGLHDDGFEDYSKRNP